MDNQTLTYITITRKEYMELINKKLNYEHLLDALFKRSKHNPYKGGLEFEQLVINHILCALETDRYYTVRMMKEEEYKKEMERLANVYGDYKDRE